MPKKHALRRALAPDVFEAFRELVFLADVQQLAPRMGLRPGTLYNKADAGDETHNQPTLRDVVLATQITGDMRVLDALNEMFGRASFDAVRHAQATDEALLELLATLGSENGQFHTVLLAALQSKRFTVQSMRQIRAEAFDAVAALMTLVQRLEDYVDDEDEAI